MTTRAARPRQLVARRRASTSRGCWSASRSGCARAPPVTASCSPGTPARRSPPAASACGRCSSARAAGSRPSRGAERALVRAAAAVELVHSATLVHDDVLDGAALRRGRPTVVAAAGRDDGERRPAICCSRAPSPSWPRRAATPRRRARRCQRRLLGARARRADPARGRLGRRDRRASATCCAASSRRRASSRPPASWARSAAARRSRARRLRPRASGSPSRCSTTCSTSPGPAERTGKRARHGPARRHGHAAADPRPRARPRARGARPARGRDRRRPPRVCDRIAATGALDDVRADGRSSTSPRRRPGCRARSTSAAGASARARRRRRRRALQLSGWPRLEVFGQEVPAVESLAQALGPALGPARPGAPVRSGALAGPRGGAGARARGAAARAPRWAGAAGDPGRSAANSSPTVGGG